MNNQEAREFMETMYNGFFTSLDAEKLGIYYHKNMVGYNGNIKVYFEDLQQHVRNLKKIFYRMAPDFHHFMATGNKFSIWFTQHGYYRNKPGVNSLETMTTYEIVDEKVSQYWFHWSEDASKYFNEKTHPNKFSEQPQGYFNQITLSKREQETLYYLLRGFTTKEIAQLLYLSPRTIEDYINSLKHKFNVSTQREITQLAIEKGYAKPTSELMELAIQQGLIKPFNPGK